jgi:D-arabinose 1-dehydrogenase-like Zn-dependent alcohol dehydrogenase
MKAVCIRQPKGDLQIENRPRPSPGSGELLIRVHACGICHGDLMVQQGAFPFVQYPIVPGHEVAGAVEEIGSGVTDFKLGRSCGLIRVVFLLRILLAMPARQGKLMSHLGLDRDDGQRRLRRICDR